MVPYFQNYLCIIWLIVFAYENRDIKISALKPYKETAVCVRTDFHLKDEAHERQQKTININLTWSREKALY